MASSEVTKLQQHLALLKDEYGKLQSHCAEVERKYTLAAASAGDLSETSFVARLLMTVATLYGRETYSDILIKLQNKSMPGHKFVLNARSDDWNEEALKNLDELDWSNLPDDVGAALLKWLYTDVVDLSRGDMFALQLMKSAANFKLYGLVGKCEQALIAIVGVRTCVKFYSAADEIGASALKEHCSGLISAHWDDLTGDDFAHMSSALLYRMLKSKTTQPLHGAVRLLREDVVFLCLVENHANCTGTHNFLLYAQSKLRGLASKLYNVVVVILIQPIKNLVGHGNCKMALSLIVITLSIFLTISNSIAPEYYLDNEDEVNEINKTESLKTSNEQQALFFETDDNDDVLLKRRLLPEKEQNKELDNNNMLETSSVTTSLIYNNSNGNETKQLQILYKKPVPTTLNIFKDYAYIYDEDTEILFEPQQIDESTVSFSTTEVAVSIDDNNVTTFNNSLRYLADFYNLVPAISKQNVQCPMKIKNESNIWYVPEKYPCWELPVLVGRLGQRKKDADDVFRIYSSKLSNVIHIDPIDTPITRKLLLDHSQTINKWCGEAPCFGDHSLCVFADKKKSSICDKDYKVSIPSIVEEVSIVNTINSMRNSIAHGTAKMYKHLPPAANMKQIIYDRDLEEMARVWLLQCLPGYDACSSLDQNYVTQLECTKSGEHCCLEFYGTEEKAECTPKYECFIFPIVGCLHAWFANAGNKLSRTDVECGHASFDTFNTVQLLWAKTDKIGCAYGERPGGETRIICNFAPGAAFFIKTKYNCGIITHKDITDSFFLNKDTGDVTDTHFLASLGIELVEIFNINQNEDRTEHNIGTNKNFTKMLRTSDLDSLQDIYKPGQARFALRDSSNGTMGLIARLVTQYIFIEEGQSKCDANDPIYIVGPPASRCLERGRKYEGLCYDFADPAPGYRLAAILAPIALFFLILYDLFSGVVRQTNY